MQRFFLPSLLSGPWALLAREARIAWAFIRYDLSSTMLPALIVTAGGLAHRAPPSPGHLGPVVARWAVYFALYIYAFCLPSQIVGFEEDRINKPDRPLPAGVVTAAGALGRWYLVMGLFLLAGLAFGVLIWTVCWSIIIVLYNFGGFDRHWFLKNVVSMGVGTLSLIAPAWLLVASPTAVVWRWLVLVAVLVAVTIGVQDFRDVAGDRARRRTLPMVMGDRRARWLTAAVQVAAPFVFYRALRSVARSPGALMVGGAVLVALACVIAVRLLRLRSARDDHSTYILWTFWFCGLLAAGAAAL